MAFSEFRIDREHRRPVPPAGVPPVFSPFDENALEAALKIKDCQECKVTVVSMGKAVPKAILQKMLAAGADDAVSIEDPEFENLDPFNTAKALAEAIRKIGPYDLVFTGRQAADWDAGVVWAGIAEMLDIPAVTTARKVEINGERALVERCVSDGIEVIETALPALISFSSEAGELRGVTVPALIKAKKREIRKWTRSDVEFERSTVVELKDLYEPDLGNIDHYLVPGDSLREKGRNLAKRLMEDGLF
jgi:electron transfer flavoprotein beta subunit